MRKIKISALQPHRITLNEFTHPYLKKFNGDMIISHHREYILGNTLKLIEEAGQYGADIVCTSEDINGACDYVSFVDQPKWFLSLCEEIPGHTFEILAGFAKKYKMYIVSCMYERFGESIYNTAFLIDRKGRLAGKYRKVQLPPKERCMVKGGTEFPVFETDFGTIGLLICYDIYFPEVARCLALKGADIIFDPALGFSWIEEIGICKARVRADENSVYLVMGKSAFNWRKPGRSLIVDPWGTIIADGGRESNVIVSAEIDMNRKKIQPDNFFEVLYSGVSDVRARQMMERRPICYKELVNEYPDVLKKFPNEHLINHEDHCHIINANKADIKSELK